MKILFVSSGNSKYGISPIIKSQGESLINDVELEYFIIKEKGLFGYIKSISKLRKKISSFNPDIVHAHYSLSGFVTSLSGARPIVVSLMGSDVMASNIYKYIIKFFYKFSWKVCIVKSKEMRDILHIKSALVIPNGVNFDKFCDISKEESQKIIGWNSSKRHLLFLGNPNRAEKNYTLAKEAYKKSKLQNIDFHFLNDVKSEDMPYWYNSSDVVILTSLREGSPNVIKEAMACNIPIVTTDVGDVKKVIGGTSGCYIADFDIDDVSKKIINAFNFSGKTKGRKNIEYLSNKKVKNKLIETYEDLM